MLRLRGVWLVLIGGLLSFTSFADQTGVVVNSPAYIYQKPDFDSQTVSELVPGARIHISTKKWGPFFRTQTRQGVIGYVSDGDIKPLGAFRDGEKRKKNGKPGADKDDHAADRSSRRAKPSWWISKMLGVSAGLIQYSEVVAKTQLQESEIEYGLKYSCPFRPLDGPFSMDINLIGHLSAPGYYNSISTNGSAGFWVALDVPIFYTLGHFWKRDGTLAIGAGPLVNFSNYAVSINGVSAQLEQVRVGAVFAASLEFLATPKIVLKLEPRYYFEQTNYYAVLGSLQFLL